MYADRKGWDLGDLVVEVEISYDGHVPSEFAVTMGLPESLTAEQVERLRVIATKCPVHSALANETAVTFHDRPGAD
jgi:putative redox protein